MAILKFGKIEQIHDVEIVPVYDGERFLGCLIKGALGWWYDSEELAKSFAPSSIGGVNGAATLDKAKESAFRAWKETEEERHINAEIDRREKVEMAKYERIGKAVIYGEEFITGSTVLKFLERDEGEVEVFFDHEWQGKIVYIDDSDNKDMDDWRWGHRPGWAMEPGLSCWFGHGGGIGNLSSKEVAMGMIVDACRREKVGEEGGDAP